MQYIMLIIFTIGAINLSFAGDELKNSIKISSSAMKAQQDRIRIIAQNIANKDSTAIEPGGDPYRRQVTILNQKKNIKNGVSKIVVKKYGHDKSNFKLIYDPSHPAADKAGYVKYPNVNINIENVDSKDAARTYEANLNMIDLSKTMFNKTLDILK